MALITATYHERTKHSRERLYREHYELDWENFPNPYRVYEGVRVRPLPPAPPLEAPLLGLMHGERPASPALLDPVSVSALLYYSVAISAHKRTSGGWTYALRVNPSAGNLHPTEVHLALPTMNDWEAGLYHYRVPEHALEQRGTGNWVRHLQATVAGALPAPALVVVFTTIPWRQAWKYRNRAYRYCLLDAGHACEALAIAARALGWEPRILGQFPDDTLQMSLGLEDEWPLLVVFVGRPDGLAATVGARQPTLHAGWPNRLSAKPGRYPAIDEVHQATKTASRGPAPPCPATSGRIPHEAIALPAPATSLQPFDRVVRGRRSAHDFLGGSKLMTQAQLATLLDMACSPMEADFTARPDPENSSTRLELMLFAHRVEGLEPGLYAYEPRQRQLHPLRQGDQQWIAAELSLGQAIAANSCVTFAMVANLEQAWRCYGERGYRYVHFDAGMLGQRLYLAAEALGLRCTGIGAFFDDELNHYLGLPEQRQVIYELACGYALQDQRLITICPG